MKPGSVIVDMAAENGGNVEGSKPGENVITDNGVNILGTGNWANEVARDASQMYAANLYNLIDDFWDKDQQTFVIDFENDVSACFITHGGEIVNSVIRSHYGL